MSCPTPFRLNPDGTADRSRQAEYITEYAPCAFCGADATSLLRNVTGHYSDAVFSIARCNRCGLVYTNPRLRQDFLDYCYQNEANLVECFLESAESTRQGAREFFRTIRALGVKGGRYLDVGCGIGTFLEVATSQGFDAAGVELNAVAATVASERFNVRNEDFFEADLPSSHFICITMTQVLEHLRDPFLALEKVERLLAPGGYLYVTVPDFGGRLLLLDRLFGDRLDATRSLWSPEDHLYYFTVSVMFRMLEAAGFSPIRVPTARRPDESAIHWNLRRMKRSAALVLGRYPYRFLVGKRP